MRISESKARRIRQTANKLVQYVKLHEYCAEVCRSNIGSKVFAETKEDGVFKRMYCCLGTCKEGFLAGCRKFISIHGHLLKTIYHGQLLLVISLNANNGIFPIAYVIARVENEDNWSWFLHTLSHDLDIAFSSQNGHLCSISKMLNLLFLFLLLFKGLLHNAAIFFHILTCAYLLTIVDTL
ncbi:hypothetical protein LINPERHAP2_LOCUS4776 [Linum perenne]